MVGLLIFIFSRPGENSLWRSVLQTSSEAGWVWNHCIGQNHALLRKLSLTILPLWACDSGGAHRKSLFLQRLCLDLMCWQGSGRDFIQAQWIGRVISRLIRSWFPCLALFFKSVPTQETRVTTLISFPLDKGLSRASSHPFFFIPWVWNNMEQDRGFVFNITEGWTF